MRTFAVPVLLAIATLSLALPAAAVNTPMTILAMEENCPAGKTFCFDQQTIEIGGGQQPITLRNNGQAPHNICFDFDPASPTCIPGPTKSETLSNGQEASDTIDFTKIQAGTYVYYCAVPGHRQLGMEGNLTLHGGADDGAGDGTTGGTNDDGTTGGTTNDGTTGGSGPGTTGGQGETTTQRTPGLGPVAALLVLGLLGVALRRRDA